MTQLYLTRHGQTEWNLEGRMQGSKDSPLTTLGRNQAIQLGKWLQNTNIDEAYSSSSERAFHTSKLILGDRDIPLTAMDELKEMNFGIWEGQTFDFIKNTYKEQYNYFWNTPHLLKDFPGETFEDLRLRVVSTINKIVKENDDKNILIVTHAIALKTLMSYFEKLPLYKLFDDRMIHPTSLSVVQFRDNKYEIIKYADTEHYNLKIS